MQTLKIVTKEQDKWICWCETNQFQTFREFIQYILDCMSEPEEFSVIDTQNQKIYGVRAIADSYGMRKRNFLERLQNVKTGI